MTVPFRPDGRPRATGPLMAAIGCISSTSPRGAPMMIANTGLGYRVWIVDGLTSRSTPGIVSGPPPIPRGSDPDIDGTIQAMILGDFCQQPIPYPYGD